MDTLGSAYRFVQKAGNETTKFATHVSLYHRKMFEVIFQKRVRGFPNTGKQMKARGHRSSAFILLIECLETNGHEARVFEITYPTK